VGISFIHQWRFDRESLWLLDSLTAFASDYPLTYS